MNFDKITILGTDGMAHRINCLLISELQQHRNLTRSCASVNPTLLGWEEAPRGSLASQSSQISDVWVHWEIFLYSHPHRQLSVDFTEVWACLLQSLWRQVSWCTLFIVKSLSSTHEQGKKTFAKKLLRFMCKMLWTFIRLFKILSCVWTSKRNRMSIMCSISTATYLIILPNINIKN